MASHSMRALLLGVLLLSGCLLGGPSLPSTPRTDRAVVEPHRVERLHSQLAKSTAEGRMAVVVARMETMGVEPAVSGYLVAGGGESSQAGLGLLAGRDVSARSELVVVSVHVHDVVAVSAALEAVTVLAAHARFSQQPGRSVLLAVWSEERTAVDDPPPPLPMGIWPRQQVANWLWVSSKASTERDFDAHGVARPIRMVAPFSSTGDRPVDFARRVLGAIRHVSRSEGSTAQSGSSVSGAHAGSDSYITPLTRTVSR